MSPNQNSDIDAHIRVETDRVTNQRIDWDSDKWARETPAEVTPCDALMQETMWRQTAAEIGSAKRHFLHYCAFTRAPEDLLELRRRVAEALEVFAQEAMAGAGELRKGCEEMKKARS